MWTYFAVNDEKSSARMLSVESLDSMSFFASSFNLSSPS